MVGKSGFWTYVLDLLAVSGTICLSFRDRFGILLEKRLSGVAELRRMMVYGKSQVICILEYGWENRWDGVGDSRSLTVQGDFDEIIDIGKTELCALSV